MEVAATINGGAGGTLTAGSAVGPPATLSINGAGTAGAISDSMADVLGAEATLAQDNPFGGQPPDIIFLQDSPGPHLPETTVREGRGHA